MLADARRNKIKKIAFRDGEVTISKVAAELGVSLETIRRDINALCAQNILTKVHGGAVPIKIGEFEDQYSKRKSTNKTVKKRLGVYVANMIKNSGIVMLSVGTTIEAAAAAFNAPDNISVITNSVSIAEILVKLNEENVKGLPVTLIGGSLNLQERFTYGCQARSQISLLHSDVAVIGAVGIDKNGAMCSSDEEGSIIAEMINSAARVILVAESKKFTQKSAFRFTSLEHIDEIITDDIYPVPHDLKKICDKHNIRIHIVRRSPHDI